MAKRQAQKQPAASKASRTRSRASFRTHRKSRPPRSPATDFTGAQRDDYLKAVGLYEQGIETVQRRNFATAAATLRQVIELFPEEHELHERCRLYLKICEREVKPPAPPAQNARGTCVRGHPGAECRSHRRSPPIPRSGGQRGPRE